MPLLGWRPLFESACHKRLRYSDPPGGNQVFSAPLAFKQGILGHENQNFACGLGNSKVSSGSMVKGLGHYLNQINPKVCANLCGIVIG